MKLNKIKTLSVVCILSLALLATLPTVSYAASNTAGNHAIAKSTMTPDQRMLDEIKKHPELQKWAFKPINGSVKPMSLPSFFKGEVLITADAARSSLGNLGHAAIDYDSYSNMSSFPDTGVKYYSNQDWAGYNSMGVIGGSSVGAAAVDDVNKYWGCSYNYIFTNKYRTDAFYCSQLVWRGFFDKGVDLSPTTTYCAPMQIWTDVRDLPTTYYSYNMPARS